MRSDRGRLFPRSCLLLPVLLAGAWGCAGFWDDVTSREFEFQALFSKPDPLEVLAKDNDGDHRRKAFLALREPKQHGGTDQDQEFILKVLITGAVSERQPLGRLAAIQSLGRFKDPRAAQGLVDAYYAVAELRPDAPSDNLAVLAKGKPELVCTFSPEIVARIQCQTLTALGQTGNPLGVELLTKVVREPRPEGQGKQQAMDVRIAAARALARFGSYQATDALVHVLRTEKDVALRDAAHEALQTATGKKLPPDAKSWEQHLSRPAPAEAVTGTDPAGPNRAAGYLPDGRSR